jgi:hypothetical protein
MKSLKCLLTIHNYEIVGTQTVSNVVGSFSESPLKRCVKKCKNCGKVKFYAFDIATNAHLDETLNWMPKLIL